MALRSRRTPIRLAQYGAQKGCSTSHLIIELLTFIHYNLDIRKRQGITLTCVDYSKAFNRQDHNNFLILLHSMGVPGWLLKITAGFLDNRRMKMAHNGGTSDIMKMPGGGPAGTTLGLLMFIVLVDKTANPGTKIEWGTLLTSPPEGRKPIEMTHMKFIDDVTIADSVDMDRELKPQEENHWVRPLIKRSRFELAVPEDNNKTNTELKKVSEFAKDNFMKINYKKSNVMLYNPIRRGIDFQPEIKIDGNYLEVKDNIRLVGFHLTDNLA